jgi:cyclic beta-1,2-glucan synthetase
MTMINPANHALDGPAAQTYKVEPYVVAADVYAAPAHVGRGGWTWYTGSAGWMHRAGLESILGLRRRGSSFSIAPCIPSTWPGYEITWRVGGTRYEIRVTNPRHRCCGVGEIRLDGAPCDPAAIPLLDDGGVHRVDVVLGEPTSGGTTAPGRLAARA